MMPGLDGWEFVKELEHRPEALLRHPNVQWGITAYADRARPVPRSLWTLEKPVDISVLLEAIKRTCPP